MPVTVTRVPAGQSCPTTRQTLSRHDDEIGPVDARDGHPRPCRTILPHDTPDAVVDAHPAFAARDGGFEREAAADERRPAPVEERLLGLVHAAPTGGEAARDDTHHGQQREDDGARLPRQVEHGVE